MADTSAKIRETDFKDANEVHRKIPEFDEDHLEDSYNEKCEGADHTCLVAFKEEEKSGYLIAYDKFEDGSYYVWMAGVSEENRREGLMTQLVARIEQIAKEKGYESVKIKTRNERRDETFPD